MHLPRPISRSLFRVGSALGKTFLKNPQPRHNCGFELPGGGELEGSGASEGGELGVSAAPEGRGGTWGFCRPGEGGTFPVFRGTFWSTYFPPVGEIS